MYFGPIPTAEAEGAILAHSLKLSDRTLKKGRVLGTADLEVLAAAGHGTVVGARLDPDDLHEDEAAGLLAAALTGAGLSATKVFTGRCNLKAEGRGLLVLDQGRLEAINRVDEGITAASLGPMARVESGQMAATIKIIPFAVDGGQLERCLDVAREGAPVLALSPFRPRAVGLIQTRLPGTKESVLDKTRAVVDSRLAALDCPPATEQRVAHDEAGVAGAIGNLLGQGCALVLLSGASAIVDRRDVLPAGMARAGASIDHFGMPVDPGNLILLGHLDQTPLIGLPGCARSPKLNGFDWVLERLIADLPVGGAELMAMGAGGLLKEIPERPLPRSGAKGKGGGTQKIAGLLLAAGQSRRMGTENKLLETVDGMPLVARTAQNLKASRANPLLAVTGHDYERVERVLEGEGLRFVHNPAFATGMASTLKRGIAALPEDVDGAVVCLGDMPLVGPAVVDALIAAFDPLEGRAICIPTWNGKRGNPVLLARQLFPEVGALSGDVGARELIARHAEEVCEVPVEDQGILVDVDTAEALESLRKPSG